MLPASVVLGFVLNGIAFEALQFFRRMQRWLLRFARQTLQQLK